MNFSGQIECINCGKAMQQGMTQCNGSEVFQNRHCSCGMRILLYAIPDNKQLAFKIEDKR